MKNIIEGIYGFKNGADRIISQTKGLSIEENFLVPGSHIGYANLAKFSKPLYAYSSSVITSNDNPNIKRVIIAKHVNNIEHDVAGRGKMEVVHYIHVPLDYSCRNVTLINSVIFNEDISNYVLSSQDLDIDERNISLNENDTSIIENKEEVLNLLDHIIYAKKNNKTLYIVYDSDSIDEFHNDFFKALSLLPVAICNSLSFITCFGGGLSTRYDIVGVPSEQSDALRSAYNDVVICRYPYNEMNVNEEIFDNPLHHLLENENELDSFNNFVKNIYVPNHDAGGALLEYLDFVNLYEKLNYSNKLISDEEYPFIVDLNNHLSFLLEHLSFIDKLIPAYITRLVVSLQNLFAQVNQISLSKTLVKPVNETFDLINKLYLSTQNKGLKEEILEIIYSFLFDYADKEEIYIAARAELVKRAMQEVSIADSLIAFIISKDECYLNTLNKVDTWSNANECQKAYLCKIYNYLFDHYRFKQSYEERVTQILKILINIITIEEIGSLIFKNNDDLDLSFMIACNLLMHLDNEDKEKELNDYIVSYLAKNNLLVASLDIVNPVTYGEHRLIKGLRDAIINAFIGGSEITSFDGLCRFIDRLVDIDPKSPLYGLIKDNLISHHLSEKIVDSIKNMTIRQVTPQINAYFDQIINYFKDSNHEVPKNIISAILSLKGQVNEYSESFSKEESLIDFRIDFILRAVALLPEKDSRAIVYEYIGKDKAEPRIGKSLKLSKEDYANEVSKVAEEFLKDKGQEGIRNNEIYKKHADFVKAIFNAQNKKRFNVHVVITIAESIANLIIYGALGLALSVTGSLLIYNNVTNQTYLTSLMILSVVIAGLSAIIGLVNVHNKGRQKIYLISALECLALVIVGLGLFTLFALLFGGK